MHASDGGEAFLFEGFRLDRNGGGLFRADGEMVPLGSRALDILRVLVEGNGQLISKQQILEVVWPGVAVEEGNLTVQVSALRKALDRDRSGASCIQTIPGRGYRMVATVRRIADRSDAAPCPSIPADALVLPCAPADSGKMRQRLVLGRPRVAFAAVAIAVAATLQMVAPLARRDDRVEPPPRLSVVVLPFRNLSGDPRDNDLARAISDEVIADLSRMPGMTVIARQAGDPRKAGEEAGVRYALDGSVRKLDMALRVNAQLVAVETGANLWAERLEQDLTNIGAGQDEIVQRLGRALGVAMTDAESARSRRERPTNPDAFDLILQARSLGLHTLGVREHGERIALYERALQLEPTSIIALTQLAGELTRLSFYSERNDLARAAQLLRDAAAINPDHPLVLDGNAYLLMAKDRYFAALSAFRRLLEEDPGAIHAYNQIGLCLIYLGRAEEALPALETALRRDPAHPQIWTRYANIGLAMLMLGQDDKAVAWTERAVAANPAAHPFMRANWNIRLAAAHARLGHADQAHRAIAEANRIWPYDTVRMHWPDDPDSPAYAAQIGRFQAALRLAGHRDHAEEEADFEVPPDDLLHGELAGLTPMAAPGAKVIRTGALHELISSSHPIVIDPLLYSWGRSIPGAIGLKHAGMGGTYSDATQSRLRQKMQALSKGDLSTPIVAAGFNSERFDGRNLALRLVALGYRNVYWYRGGREAWEVAGLPEAAIDVQDW